MLFFVVHCFDCIFFVSAFSDERILFKVMDGHHFGAGVYPVTLASSVVPGKSVVGHPSVAHVLELCPVVSRAVGSLTDDLMPVSHGVSVCPSSRRSVVYATTAASDVRAKGLRPSQIA